jgi:hypothetical protein
VAAGVWRRVYRTLKAPYSVTEATGTQGTFGWFGGVTNRRASVPFRARELLPSRKFSICDHLSKMSLGFERPPLRGAAVLAVLLLLVATARAADHGHPFASHRRLLGADGAQAAQQLPLVAGAALALAAHANIEGSIAGAMLSASRTGAAPVTGAPQQQQQAAGGTQFVRAVVPLTALSTVVGPAGTPGSAAVTVGTQRGYVKHRDGSVTLLKPYVLTRDLQARPSARGARVEPRA